LILDYDSYPCHSERRKVKGKEMDAAISAVLAGGENGSEAKYKNDS
jgi:hypothetical protein